MAEMNPEQLRRVVIRATRPLLSSHETLTMAQIARSAGISEDDLLSVFADKEAVMEASVASLAESMTALLRPAEEVEKIRQIPIDQPLASRLMRVIEILDVYSRRVRDGIDELQSTDDDMVFGVVNAPGVGFAKSRDDIASFDRSPELRNAVSELLKADAGKLRVSPQFLAGAFVTLAFSGRRAVISGQSALLPESIVELFLHGALVAE